MSPLTLGIVAGAEWPADPALCLAITAEIAAKSAELQALTMALNVYRDALHAAEMQLVAAQSRHPDRLIARLEVASLNGAALTIDALTAQIEDALAALATDEPLDLSAL
jgi:hypothetical protein